MGKKNPRDKTQKSTHLILSGSLRQWNDVRLKSCYVSSELVVIFWAVHWPEVISIWKASSLSWCLCMHRHTTWPHDGTNNEIKLGGNTLAAPALDSLPSRRHLPGALETRCWQRTFAYMVQAQETATDPLCGSLPTVRTCPPSHKQAMPLHWLLTARIKW